MKKLWLIFLFIGQVALAIQGGIPANPNNGNNGNGQGNNGNGNGNQGGNGQGNNGQPGQQPGQIAAMNAATVKAIASDNATIQAVNSSNTGISSAITHSSITLRSLLLNPHDSYDLWANSTGIFDKLNIATISAGFDYRITPRWILGMTSNWTMGRHIDGSAMNFGPYTGLSQWGFYALASELLNREPETYITFAQLGYNLQLGNFIVGPFYAVQYNSKANSVLNQTGLQFDLPHIGRLYSELQVMYQNNCEETILHRRDSIWAGVSTEYKVKDNLYIIGGYNIEGNKHFQTNEVTIGFKTEF